MPSASDTKVDVLIQEVRELKRDVRELRLLLLYGLLKTEEEGSRGRFNETLLVFAKQALNAAAEQLAELDRKSGTQAAKGRSRTSVKSREDATQTPIADVNNEIAILKREMAKSLREAANDVDDNVEHDTE